MAVSSFDVVRANSLVGPIAFTTGRVLYVNNSSSGLITGAIGGSDGNSGASPLEPLSTIATAVGLCSANRGDTIYVMPGHSESVAATDLTINVAGVSVVGLGRGAARPTLNLTATGSTIAISAANVLFKNFLVTGGIDAIVAVFTISAADVKLEDVEYRDVTGQCTDGILTTAAADRLEISGLRWDGATAAGTNAAIAIVGGDRLSIHDSRFDGNFAVGVIDVRTTATTDLEVYNCTARTRNSADIFLIDTITASTGMIGPGLNLRLNDNAANITEAITGATFVQFGGGASGLIDGSGILVVNAAGEVALPINTTQSADL